MHSSAVGRKFILASAQRSGAEAIPGRVVDARRQASEMPFRAFTRKARCLTANRRRDKNRIVALEPQDDGA